MKTEIRNIHVNFEKQLPITGNLLDEILKINFVYIILSGYDLHRNLFVKNGCH